MTCPYCGDQTTVLETREYANFDVRRIRECLDCGARFTTRETVVKSRRPKQAAFRVKHWMDIALAPANRNKEDKHES